MSSSSSTKRWAPPTIAPRPTRSCSTQSARAGVGAALGAALEDQRVERLLALHLAAAAQGAADVERRRRAGRRSRPGSAPRPAAPQASSAGEREEGEEEEQVALQGRRVGVELDALRRVARGRGRRRGRPGPSPGSRAGRGRRRSPRSRRLRSPRSAPSRATIAISVSGIAVPTAASMLPTAPSPSSSRWPIHSTALVKSSAPARMTAKLTSRRTASIGAGYRQASSAGQA